MPLPTRELDESCMRRAVDLAVQGRGRVEPNPMVGCVIVKNGRTIGEGFHARFGGPHAEIDALSHCIESPRGATAYVTLEPCCHTDKKMPPCAPRLLEAGLARIVAGTNDPNPAVDGKGIGMLRAAGVDATTGMLESSCRQLNAAFFAMTKLHRPYVTLKWAQSSNGKIAGGDGSPIQISNERSRRAVHELRSRCDAILVGVNTIFSDDPLLTVRDVPVHRPLKRFVLDTHLRIPLESKVVSTVHDAATHVFCSEDAYTRQPVPVGELSERGVECLPLAMSHGRLSLNHLMQMLGEHPITHLLVEPGPTLARSFIQENLADRIWIIRSPAPIDAPFAPAAAHVPFAAVASRNLDGDVLTEHLNPNSGAFFEPLPSADLVLIDQPR